MDLMCWVTNNPELFLAIIIGFMITSIGIALNFDGTTLFCFSNLIEDIKENDLQVFHILIFLILLPGTLVYFLSEFVGIVLTFIIDSFIKIFIKIMTVRIFKFKHNEKL